MSDEVKPGWKTTEFWVTLVTMALGVMAALGKITPEQSSTMTTAMIQLGGLVATVLAAFGYDASRAKAKGK